MAKFDKRGNPISYGGQQAIDALDHVFDLLHAYQADPLAEVDKIIVDHPAFGCARLSCWRASDHDRQAFELESVKSVEAAEAAPNANDRERMHISAVRAWLDGDRERAIELWGRGRSPIRAICWRFSMRMSVTSSSVIRTVARSCCPGVSALGSRRTGLWLCCRDVCVGLEEAGDYEQAKARGREAVALNKRTVWPSTPSTHVLEMQGRAAEVRTTLPLAPMHGAEQHVRVSSPGGTRRYSTETPMTRLPR